MVSGASIGSMNSPELVLNVAPEFLVTLESSLDLLVLPRSEIKCQPGWPIRIPSSVSLFEKLDNARSLGELLVVTAWRRWGILHEATRGSRDP
jgi:hypothetical protein